MRVVATRLHTSNEAVPIDPEQIKAWCQNVLSYSDLLIVVVDNRYFQRVGKMLMRFGNRVKLFHIHPWIGYTQPLNMIIEKALSVGATKLLFQSIEVTALPEDIKSLERHLDSNTLVVGAKLHEMHGHVNEKVELTGWTTPWNTLALWNLEKLGLTGFLTVSSGNLPGIPGGVEEVVTISLLQTLHPYSMDAKMIELKSVVWNTQWSCKEREAYHAAKMASKNERAEKQLRALGISPGFVTIVKDEDD
ncbi:hypothetical protein RZR97_04615 [Hydrogenimonas thermophila]|uniref:hypothetical protein n=1 Tax=Hydrogenimonas thermophila TaxID=223786 RepID=UPI0029374539|nr:hypothetical protein [Hydrogenimonas thermophila]WOE70858.1 hypothetical protein RZR91_04635 [Hydrogenimonas thermophila]WOE73376.1 hypothetical protein RZR97_04615 [Hydrogenimonas thermophila]